MRALAPDAVGPNRAFELCVRYLERNTAAPKGNINDRACILPPSQVRTRATAVRTSAQRWSRVAAEFVSRSCIRRMHRTNAAVGAPH